MDPQELIHDRNAPNLLLRTRVPVGILGATGSVGQRLVQMLANHPWLQLVAVAASEKSVGKSYKEATKWMLPTLMPQEASKLVIQACTPDLPCKVVFSALSSSIAGEVEEAFAAKWYIVITMAKNHRMDSDVPLLIPEVNSDHVKLVKKQKWYASGGMIIAKPNCAVIGLAMALKPLALEFGIKKVTVVTMQSISGAGFPGVASLSISDNIIPYIDGEEEKVETETQKVLGSLIEKGVNEYPLAISATCTRVPVTEGHLEVVQVELKEKSSLEAVKKAWQEFSSPIESLQLPSAPKQPLYYFDEPDFPQPKVHRDIERGMAVSIGRLRECPLNGYKFVLLSHNTVRGAAGGAILIAELLVKNGYVFW
jgi:aspartate-semialdehyde dehydrogenase